MRESGEAVHSFVHSYTGSVSVYFITVTAAFVLLTALLIDFSRIAAFRKQAELAVQSGARSVLSSFDPVVYDRYGLFVRGGEDGRELFRTAAEGHWGGRENGGAFPYLDADWTETDVTESRPLGDHEVFRRQVLEEMKYKAPIDLALELAGRFRGVSPALKEAADTVDLLEKMRKAYDRREAALDQALEIQGKAGERELTLLRELAPYPPVSLGGSLPAGEVRHAADAAMRYADYVAKRLEDEMPPGPPAKVRVRKYTAVIAAYESSARSLASALSEAGGRVRADAEQAYGKAAEALRRARAENEEMRRLAAEAASAEGSGELSDQGASGAVGQGAPGMAAGGGDVEKVDAGKVRTIADIRLTARQLVLPEAFFATCETELALQRDRGASLGAEAVNASSAVSGAPSSTGMEGALRQAAGRLQAALNGFAEAYGPNGSVIGARRASFREHRAQDGERKSLEKEADAEWSGWNRLLGGIGNAQGTPEEREAFRKADRLSRENAEFNRNLGTESGNESGTESETGTGTESGTRTESGFGGGVESGAESFGGREGRGLASGAESFGSGEEKGLASGTESAAEERDRAMEGSNGMLDALEGAVTGLRDSLYFSEYVHGRLSRYSPAQVKQLLGGGEAELALTSQEAEYVLYGFANPSGNIAAAYGEIFAFRLAVRTMEGLVECRGMGHPLLILAAALLYGLRAAVQDIHSLLERDSVPLSKYLNVETNYADYLRLFYLLHGDSPNGLSRSIAVMEYRTGLDFSQAYTYVSAEGTASLRLWFFPGLMKAIGRTGRLGGTVKGNRYEAAYTADSSYQ
ncbi:hypothetical protein GE107_13505 [Cohnella sp. CFH 77786]|uniref:TadE family protein n=1 Tax=Cohnella sp. CFH 77786 TaxID=2662265 RepID=UPI001C60D492|nr:TadE family protein [Cohnella sp. CFH 77786]MBW5447080.1 hypothetical protein [Cohnella sp. CFH 77786]